MFKSNKHKMTKANIIKGVFLPNLLVNLSGKHYLKIRLQQICPLTIHFQHGIGDNVLFSNALEILKEYPESVVLNMVNEYDKKIKILNLLNINFKTEPLANCNIISHVTTVPDKHASISYGNDLLNTIETFTGFKFSKKCETHIPKIIKKTKPILYEYALSNQSKHDFKTVNHKTFNNRIKKYLIDNNIKFVDLDSLSFDQALLALEQSEKYIGIDSLWAHVATVFNMQQIIFWNKQSWFKKENFYYPHLQKCIYFDEFPKNIFESYKSSKYSLVKSYKVKGSFNPHIYHYLGYIDYNHIVMPQIDINVTMKCTMSCSECTRLIPAFKGIKQKDRTPDELYEDMSKIAKAVTFTSGIIIGGEPTLHNNLLECINAVKRSGVCKYIMLATNGATLNKIKDEIIENVDIFRLTVYPGKLDELDITKFENRLNQKGKSLERYYPSKFYAIYSKNEIKDRKLERCWQMCEKCFNYYDRRLYMCGPAHPINKILKKENQDGMDLSTISIEKLKDNVIYRKEYNACKHCYLCSNKGMVTWTESTKKEWIDTHV